ncbi:MAG: hypothetical protein RIA69_11505 [Cyclobacteriaceae bacterium]
MDNQQLDKIDLFLREELNQQESQRFQNELQTNPELNAEFQFQKQVFDGLNQFRHSQLKARLDGIDVTGVYGGGVLSSGLSKIVIGFGVIATIGFGLWYFNTLENEDLSNANIAEIDAPFNKEYNWVWKIPVPEVPKQSIEVSSSPVNKLNNISDNKQVEVLEEFEAESNNEDFEIEINRPQLLGMTDDSNFESEKISTPKIEESEIDGTNLSPIDIKIERSLGKLAYKYFDGKLFLYGDFTKEPYQILEINKKNGREIFMYFKNEYYPIKMVNEVSELKQLNDPDSKKQLDILRENKTN